MEVQFLDHRGAKSPFTFCHLRADRLPPKTHHLQPTLITAVRGNRVRLLVTLSRILRFRASSRFFFFFFGLLFLPPVVLLARSFRPSPSAHLPSPSANPAPPISPELGFSSFARSIFLEVCLLQGTPFI
jgi:hypothetical protein